VPRNVDEQTTEFWQTKARQFVDRQMKRVENLNTAKNIILFLGDGMGVATQAAARMYMGGEELELSFEEFPYVGLSKVRVQYIINHLQH
jgi:alkaline phosphatase